MLHEIIVTGSLAFDQIMDLPGKFSSYILPEKIHNINVSFVTDTHHRRFGGTGGNQAYSLALLKKNPILVATAGNDFPPYKLFLEKNNIDCSLIQIVKDELTAMGIAITDEKDNQIWGFSKGAMIYAKDYKLQAIIKKLRHSEQSEGTKNSMFVLIAPNEPKAMENYIDECIAMNIPFSFDPAFYIPTLSIKSLIKGITHATIIFGNDYEMELLRTKLKLKRLMIQNDQIFITTLGEKGSKLEFKNQSSNIKKIQIKPAKIRKTVDPTGAGDAYRSGFISGYLDGKDMQTCGQMGSIAAAYAVEHYGTMEHSYTEKEFWQRYKVNYN